MCERPPERKDIPQRAAALTSSMASKRWSDFLSKVSTSAKTGKLAHRHSRGIWFKSRIIPFFDEKLRAARPKKVVIGVNGAEGSGTTTVCRHLQSQYNFRVVDMASYGENRDDGTLEALFGAGEPGSIALNNVHTPKK